MSFINKIKKAINFFLNSLDIIIERKSFIRRLTPNEDVIIDFGLLKYIKKPEKCLDHLKNLQYSKSQLRQDLFVLNELEFKK